MIKILIVEDQKILLDGLANTLSSIEDFEVVGKLTDIADSIDFLKKNESPKIPQKDGIGLALYNRMIRAAAHTIIKV